MALLNGFTKWDKKYLQDTMHCESQIIFTKVMKARGWVKLIKKTSGRIHGKCIDFSVKYDNIESLAQWLRS